MAETMMTGQGDTSAADNGEQGQTSEQETGAQETEETTTGQAGEGENGDKGEGTGEEGSDAGEKGEGEDKPEVPEKYEWNKPEGFEGELDEAALESFEPLAKELGLTQEQADKLVGIHAESLQKAHQQAAEQHSRQMEAWTKELRNDPEFGGAAFDGNIKSAQKAVEQFGSEGLKEALEETGLGNHPALVRTFAMIGKAISEDGFVSGGKSGGARSAADIFYGKKEG